MKSILDYSVEVDEAEDKKKEDKKAFTFKKVIYQPGIILQKVLYLINSTHSYGSHTVKTAKKGRWDYHFNI